MNKACNRAEAACLWVLCSLLCSRPAACFQSLLYALQAFASFAAALAVQPTHAHALVACAAIYRSSGQLANAVCALETAAAAAPADAAVQQAYAAGLNAVGESHPGSLALLSTWPRVPCTSSIPFIIELCSIMAQRLEIPTVNSRVFVSAATQLKSAGQQEAALVKYQQAVKVCPAYADGFYDLGVYYSENNQVGCIASSTSTAYQPSCTALSYIIICAGSTWSQPTMGIPLS